MYLRIRKLSIDKVDDGEYNVVLAKSGAQRSNTQLGRPMKMEPGVLEWWDGITWNPVNIVDEDASMESPYGKVS